MRGGVVNKISLSKFIEMILNTDSDIDKIMIQDDKQFSSSTELRSKITNQPDDVELDSLLLDNFPKVFNKISRGLRRDEKINLLLDYCQKDPNRVLKLDRLLS